MHPILLLARLNAKTSSMELPPDGSSGGITAADVAAALGMMPRFHSSLLLWVYNHDDTVAEPGGVLLGSAVSLIDLVKGLLKRVWHEQRERLDDDKAEALAWLLLHEVRTAPSCKRCQGRGFGHSATEGPVECPTCRGSGHVKIASRKRADVIGVSHTTFIDQYQRRYEIAFSTLVGIRQTALKKLHWQFYGEKNG